MGVLHRPCALSLEGTLGAAALLLACILHKALSKKCWTGTSVAPSASAVPNACAN